MKRNHHLPLLEMLEKVLGRTTSSGGIRRAAGKTCLLLPSVGAYEYTGSSLAMCSRIIYRK